VDLVGAAATVDDDEDEDDEDEAAASRFRLTTELDSLGAGRFAGGDWNGLADGVDDGFGVGFATMGAEATGTGAGAGVGGGGVVSRIEAPAIDRFSEDGAGVGVVR
jgi:hypothetical protein